MSPVERAHAREVSLDEALARIAAEWGDGWVLQPPVEAHIPRRQSLGDDVPTRRFYVAHDELGDAVMAQLPATPAPVRVVRVPGLAAERWTEDEG